MKQMIFLLLVGVLIFPSCCDDEPSVELFFKLEYDGEPLVMFEDYTFPNGKTLNFSRFSFYISELKIGNQSVDRVDYLDLTAAHTSLDKASVGHVYRINDLVEEQVNSLSFAVGVNSTVNASIPGDYVSSQDLSLSSEYWTPWSSYIFSKTEGRIDADEDGSNELAFALHLGLDQAYRTVALDVDLAISNSTIQQDIVIDLKKLFEGSQGLYDLEGVPQIHQTTSSNEINELCDNLSQAFSLD